MPARPLSSSSSSSSPSPPPSLLSYPDVLLGPPHFRILKWIYQYVAAFPALKQTREEIEGLMAAQAEEPHLHPGASPAAFDQAVDEVYCRFRLRECFDCLTRDEGLYNGVEMGLERLVEATDVANMDFGPSSSLFELTQLVVVMAAMQAAEETATEEHEAEEKGQDADAIDRASTRFDDVLHDLLQDRTGGSNVTAAEQREQHRILARIEKFCIAYRDLARLSFTSTAAKKQIRAIQSLYPQQALVDAVTAAILDVAKGLNLSYPMLNLLQHELVSKKLVIPRPAQLKPASASVVDLPPLPTISLPPPPAAPARATVRSPALPSSQGKRKAASPARGGGVMGGQLKAARQQLNRRGVDPLHASIDEATELQEEAEVKKKDKGKKKGARDPPAQDEAESNLQVEDEVEDGEEEEEATPARVKPGAKRRAITSPPDEVKAEPTPSRRLHRRAATKASYDADLIPIDIDEDTDDAVEEEEEDTPKQAGRGSEGPTSAVGGKRKAGSLSGSKKKKAKVSSLSDAEMRRGNRIKQRRPFSKEEEKWLTKGVALYRDHHRKWQLILKEYKTHFAADRTSVDLKDKWRNIEIKKAGGIKQYVPGSKKKKKKSKGLKKKKKGGDGDEDDEDDSDEEEEDEEEDEDEEEKKDEEGKEEGGKEEKKVEGDADEEEGEGKKAAEVEEIENDEGKDGKDEKVEAA